MMQDQEKEIYWATQALHFETLRKQGRLAPAEPHPAYSPDVFQLELAEGEEDFNGEPVWMDHLHHVRMFPKGTLVKATYTGANVGGEECEYRDIDKGKDWRVYPDGPLMILGYWWHEEEQELLVEVMPFVAQRGTPQEKTFCAIICNVCLCTQFYIPEDAKDWED
jgi:hypothetical protein